MRYLFVAEWITLLKYWIPVSPTEKTSVRSVHCLLGDLHGAKLTEGAKIQRLKWLEEIPSRRMEIISLSFTMNRFKYREHYHWGHHKRADRKRHLGTEYNLNKWMEITRNSTLSLPSPLDPKGNAVLIIPHDNWCNVELFAVMQIEGNERQVLTGSPLVMHRYD